MGGQGAVFTSDPSTLWVLKRQQVLKPLIGQQVERVVVQVRFPPPLPKQLSHLAGGKENSVTSL